MKQPTQMKFQNIQAAHAAQYQKNKQPIKKWEKDLTYTFPKKIYRWLINT